MKKYTRNLEFKGKEGKEGIIPATLSTETPVKRGDFFEVLRHKKNSIDLSRFPLPVIESHNQNTVNIGIAENPVIHKGKLTASVRFGNSTRAKELKSDIETGVVTGLSIGYQWLNYSEETRNGDDYIIVDSFLPMELSIVAVPADSNAGFYRDLNMTETVEQSKETPATAKGLKRLAEQFGITNPDSVVVELIDRGLSEDKAERELFKMAKQELWARRVDSETTRSGCYETNDNQTNLAQAYTDTLIQRAGVNIENAHVAAKDFKGLSIPEMARSILQANGVYDSMARPDGLVKRAMSTSDFPGVLANVTNKILQHAYELQRSTYESWTGKRIAGLYNDLSIVNLSEMPQLEKIVEWGEYTNGSISDSKETITMAKYGRIFSLSWESLARDDVSAFDGLLTAFGREARRTESDIIYTALTSNPLLSDGTAFFDVSRGNKAESPTALNITTLNQARSAMRRYKGLGATQYIDAIPRVLLVPVALETVAQQLIAEITPTKNTDVRPKWIADLEVVADPRLDDVSETAWYLFSEPSQLEGFVRVYLDDNPVTIEQREGFETDGFDIKCKFVMGAGGVDWRSAYMNEGALI